MNTEKLLKNVKLQVLDRIKEELQQIETKKKVYFHDIIHEIMDSNTPTSKEECLELIKNADIEHFDDGIIDKSSTERMFITMAYCSIEQFLFNDDFIQELQTDLNNEEITKSKAKDIIIKIMEYKNKEGLRNEFIIYKDNKSQIFLKKNFEITEEDFKPYFEKGSLVEKQLIKIADNDFKILTSNKKINENAIVIEQRSKYTRVYLMDINKDLDIRNLFKLKCISEETGFNLSPQAYIEQTTEEYDKEAQTPYARKNYLTEFKTKKAFLNHIVEMSNKLTLRS